MLLLGGLSKMILLDSGHPMVKEAIVQMMGPDKQVLPLPPPTQPRRPVHPLTI